MQLKRYAIYGRSETVNFLPFRPFDKLIAGLAADPNRLIPERESSQDSIDPLAVGIFLPHLHPLPRWKDAFLSCK